jgi:cytochrome c oxidase subunit 2
MSQVVANYPPAMPPYTGRVTEEEILQMIAYIKSLGAPAAASAAAQPAQ